MFTNNEVPPPPPEPFVLHSQRKESKLASKHKIACFFWGGGVTMLGCQRPGSAFCSSPPPRHLHKHLMSSLCLELTLGVFGSAWTVSGQVALPLFP